MVEIINVSSNHWVAFATSFDGDIIVYDSLGIHFTEELQMVCATTMFSPCCMLHATRK